MEGKPPVAPEALPRADFQRVSPDYFKTIGVPILRGREPRARPIARTPRASAVVNQSMARRFWPGEDPDRHAGSAWTAASQARCPGSTIVGVSGDVRQYGLANPPIEQIYLSLPQFPGLSTTCLAAHGVRPAADGARRCARPCTRSGPSSRWTTSARSRRCTPARSPRRA